MEVAGLHITVESSDAKTAEANLKAMTGASKGAESASRSLGGATAAAATQARSLAGAANQNVTVLNTTAAAARRAAAAMQGASFSTANVAAQFQDIAVTSAMGMNPLQIALQQGTQISAVFGGKGAAGSLKMLGAAFMSVISPVSLATIALVGLAAAGLQMVDWGAVAKTALVGVAWALDNLTPYVLGASAVMALLYAPSIISGIWGVTAAISGMAVAATRAAVAFTAAWLGAIGPVGWFILGLSAVVAAALLFRDELNRIFGADIVGAAKQGINYIIGAFVGGFNGIKETWSLLPAAIGDIVIIAANGVISGVEGMLGKVAENINGFIEKINGAIMLIPENLRGGWTGLGTIDPPKFGDIANPNAGAAGKVAGEIKSAMADAMSTDYVGEFVTTVTNGVSKAADAVRGLADGIGGATGKMSKEAKRQAEAYADLTRSANQFIAGQNLEAQSLGMTEEAANRLRYEQEMLNKAANDSIKLGPEQRSELAGLAAQMAAVEEATRRVTEAYNFGKGVFTGMFSDITSYLRQQSSEWTNLGDVARSVWEGIGLAGANALQKIADKALENAANGIWDMIFGAVMGGITGNFIGGTAGAPALQLGFQKGIPGFASGTSSAPGGLSWVGEQGPELMNVPRGAQIFPNHKSMAMAANQNQANDNGRGDLHIHINGSGLNEEQLGRAIAAGIRDYDQSLAPKVEAKFRTMQNDPRAADGGW